MRMATMQTPNNKNTAAAAPGASSRLRVLVVDDEEDLRHLVGTALKFEGMAVSTAADGGEALSLVRREQFDVVVLDVMLPDLDGFEVLRRVREMPSAPAVLFLTARDDVDDRIRGLTQGADDYLGKPFSVGELVARVQAVSRRAVASVDNCVRIGDLVIDPDAAMVTKAGATIEMTPTEFRLLETLAEYSGKVLSKVQLMEMVWGWDFEGDANIVETYVSYLRKKLEGHGPKMIHTVRGFGYSLRAPSEIG